MGTLVFQATLGGAVNLAGPNTASTTTFTLPAADGTNGQALTTNGSGTLAFATVGASAATPTALGTVYGVTSSSSPNSTFLGYQAGFTNSTGLYNTFLGSYAGYTSNGGSSAYNTCVGASAGYALSTGVSNTFVGSLTPAGAASGGNMTTGSKNTILGNFGGNNDGLDIRTGDNYVVISDGSGNRQITMKEGQTLALDSAVPNAGTGITFPATQSASSDANTLDDYEEGTWTPTVTLNSGTASAYTIGTATYTKTGRMVVVLGSIIPTNGTFGSTNGYARITGLPFTVGTRNGAGSGGNNSLLTGSIAATFAYSTTVDSTFTIGVASTNEYSFVATYFV
jgi:hypothetical protein